MRTRIFFYSIFIFFTLMGCKKPPEHPELLDPIYQDFLSEAEKIKKEIESKKKEIDSNKAQIESETAIEGEKKIAKESIFVLKNEIFKLDQKEKYFRFSAESRKIYIRKKSLDAFKNDSEYSSGHIKNDYSSRKIASLSPKKWLRGDKRPKETPKPKSSGGH